MFAQRDDPILFDRGDIESCLINTAEHDAEINSA